MNERAVEIYAYMAAIVGASSAMSEVELAELKAWERENLDGHSVGTSDWPGWEKYIGPKPVFETREIDRSGFVYLIRNGETDYYKIGIAKDVGVRLNALQTGNPEPLCLIGQFLVADARAKEKELHKRFNSCRVSREWFVLSQSVVEGLLWELMHALNASDEL